MHGLGNDFIIFDNIKDLNIHEIKFIKKLVTDELELAVIKF
jgi:diaminopimelate epimerase